MYGIDGIHRQGQGDDGIAAVGVGSADGVVVDVGDRTVGCYEREPMVLVCAARADVSVEVDGVNRMHSQSQGHDRVAADGVGGADGVVVDTFDGAVRCDVRESVVAEGVTGADILIEMHGVNRIHRQGQGHDRVATVRTELGQPQGVVVDGQRGAVRRDEREPVVVESVTRADCFSKMDGVNRIHRQGQRHDAVAAVNIGSVNRVVIG